LRPLIILVSIIIFRPGGAPILFFLHLSLLETFPSLFENFLAFLSLILLLLASLVYFTFRSAVPAEPIIIRDSLETATVGMANVEVAIVANQKLLFILSCVADVTVVCKGLHPI
jgi:hypothetical protein